MVTSPALYSGCLTSPFFEGFTDRPVGEYDDCPGSMLTDRVV